VECAIAIFLRVETLAVKVNPYYPIPSANGSYAGFGVHKPAVYLLAVG
jgi:hypothetical protein